MDGPLRTERLDPGATAAQWRHAAAASISLEERHRALELKLRDTEQRLADLVQISTDWIWETDAEHRFTYFSGRLTEVSGVEPSAVIGKTRTDIMNVALDEKARHLDDLRARRPFKDFTYQIAAPRGVRYFRISGKPRFDERGVFLGYRGTGRDVTGEIEVEDRVKLIQARFIEAIEHVPASLMLHDADDRLVVCNSITKSFFPGLDRFLTPGTTFEELMRAVAHNGHIVSAIGREDKWVAERMQAHRNPQGAINRNHVNGRWVQIIERRTSEGGTIGIRMDVTEIKQKEEQLAHQTALLQATLENISQGLSVFDSDLRLVAFNNQFLKLLDFSLDYGEVGRPFADFIRYNASRGEYGPGDQENQVEERVEQARHPKPHCFERVRPDGTTLEIRGNPMPMGGFVTTYTDVTQHKRIERTLQANAKRLEEYARDLKQSNLELEQFAYVASHDLQEPLRMVGSYCQLLQRRYKGKLDQDADEFIGYAVEGATRMQRMINDLLAYSRVGRSGKGFEEVACREIVEAALANLKIAIQESGATVNCGDLPTLKVEKTQLVQLFQNLIGNAIKFRGERVPVIDIAAEREGALWHFSVRDNGIGIEPQYSQRIFLIFQRLHDRSKYDGTGIGLAVCKKVVEHHGGRIWVESEPGRGTEFHFTLAADIDNRGDAP